jgi:hypothetical protein
MEITGFSKTLAATNQSIWLCNPKEHHQNYGMIPKICENGLAPS